jgi:hypothetical protein
MIVSICHELMFQFSHKKATNTIQKFHNIDTMDMKKDIICPYWWVGFVSQAWNR